MRMRLVFLGILLIGLQLHSLSQHENENYSISLEKFSVKKNDFKLILLNNNFIKNNEYFSGQTKGYTFIGTEIQPEIVYGLGGNVRLFLGWNYLYYFGSDALKHSLPVFRMEYDISKKIKISMGEIRGKLDHQLIEPMYSMDNYFMQNPEYGFRFFYYDSIIQNDYWIDWQKFLNPDAVGNEQFVMGNVFKYSFLKYKKFRFCFNTQFTGKHIGGQSVKNTQALQTFLNIAPGIEISYLFDKKLLQKISFNSWFVLSKNASDSLVIPFENGYGFYNTLFVKSKYLDLMLSLWNAETYFSPIGEYLFQSVSNYNKGFVDTQRIMLSSKLMYYYKIDDGVTLGLRFDSYLDLQKIEFNYFYGINIKTNIFLY